MNPRPAPSAPPVEEPASTSQTPPRISECPTESPPNGDCQGTPSPNPRPSPSGDIRPTGTEDGNAKKTQTVPPAPASTSQTSPLKRSAESPPDGDNLTNKIAKGQVGDDIAEILGRLQGSGVNAQQLLTLFTASQTESSGGK